MYWARRSLNKCTVQFLRSIKQFNMEVRITVNIFVWLRTLIRCFIRTKQFVFDCPLGSVELSEPAPLKGD